VFIDASAIIAILVPEADAGVYWDRIEKHGGPFFVSPLVRFEATISLAQAKLRSQNDLRSPTLEMLTLARDAIDYFIEDFQIQELAISPAIGELALKTAMTYGKAVRHPAALNFGDCYAYACAKIHKLPLLYKGNDFAKTDLA
jgi:ribonuclease VapC